MPDEDQPQFEHQLPAQKAMKQTAKTPSERGEKDEEESDAGQTADEPTQTQRKGDAPVGTADNEGSSPYADRSRKEASQREE